MEKKKNKEEKPKTTQEKEEVKHKITFELITIKGYGSTRKKKYQ